VKPNLLSLIVTVALTAGCDGGDERTAAEQAPPLVVTLATIEYVSLPSTFEAGGIVRARSTATIASRVMAPVLDVHVRAGERVRRGATLITLDSREVTANRARAAATLTSAAEAARAADSDVRSAQAALVLARATYERIQTLHEQRSATAQELDQARSVLDAAEAQLTASRARVAAATAAREAAVAASAAATITTSYATLTAPFDGVVTSRAVDPGSLVTPGLPLLTLEDSSTFRLEVTLDEARAGHIVPGQAVEAVIGAADSGESRACDGTVSEVARIDPASHSFLVKIDLPRAPALRSGLFGRARFTGPSRRVLAVPSTALVRRGQLTFVYAVDTHSRARLRAVSPGAATAERSEILAGLREAERVVVNPPASLADGAHVTGGRP
jgi:RND family efflux transporter MFP subunit